LKKIEINRELTAAKEKLSEIKKQDSAEFKA